MKKLLALTLALLFSVPGLADVYVFGETYVKFRTVDGVTVNRSCRGPGCRAYDGGLVLLTVLDKSAVAPGGKNPCAVACKKDLGGLVVIGRDLGGNEQSFCYFKDESYLRCF